MVDTETKMRLAEQVAKEWRAEQLATRGNTLLPLMRAFAEAMLGPKAERLTDLSGSPLLTTIVDETDEWPKVPPTHSPFELRHLRADLAATKAALDARTKANGELREVIEELKKGLPRCGGIRHERCEKLATIIVDAGDVYALGRHCDVCAKRLNDHYENTQTDLPHAAVVRRFGW